MSFLPNPVPGRATLPRSFQISHKYWAWQPRPTDGEVPDKVQGNQAELFDPPSERRFRQTTAALARKWTGNALGFHRGSRRKEAHSSTQESENQPTPAAATKQIPLPGRRLELGGIEDNSGFVSFASVGDRSMTIEIVNEVRRARETYAAQFNYDLDAIFADLRRRRRGTRRKVVDLSKRKKKPVLVRS